MNTNEKKEICLITRHAIVNYGSFLQTLATQDILNQNGLKVTVLDYVRDDEHYKNVTELLLKKSKKWNKNVINRSIYRIVHGPDHVISGIVFEKYRKKYLNLSKRISSVAEEYNVIPQADIYCTGSDQVWGEIGSNDLDSAYFLNFKRKENSKCISLSASFGKSAYPEERMKKFSELLKKYSDITVREDSAVKIVESVNNKAEKILDPTLIAGCEYWDKFINRKRKIPHKYVLLYQLNSNPKMDEYAEQFAKNANLPLVRVSVEFYNKTKPGKFKWCLSPFDFLNYVKNAEYMITDSFHGTVFAMMFHVQFLEILPPEKQARNKSILKQFNLEDRILNDFNSFDFINNHIDYSDVERLLNIEQVKSRKLILNIINK